MNPNEFIFSIKSPKRNNEPSLVNPKTVTKTALSHSKPFCINGTFKIATANISWISNPFQTNCQSIPFLFREKAKAIPGAIDGHHYEQRHLQQADHWEAGILEGKDHISWQEYEEEQEVKNNTNKKIKIFIKHSSNFWINVFHYYFNIKGVNMKIKDIIKFKDLKKSYKNLEKKTTKIAHEIGEIDITEDKVKSAGKTTLRRNFTS